MEQPLPQNNLTQSLPSVNPTSIKHFTLLQDWAKTYLKMLRLRMKKMKHRKYVIEELITTEEQNFKILTIILNEVKNPALADNFLNKEEAKQIFCDLDEIQSLHSMLSQNLRKAFQNFDTRSSKIADIILRFLPMFKMYFLYCDNFKLANARLERMRKDNHKFITFLKPLEYNPPLQNLDFISQLVKPVQRLPKYVLLFKDLKKNTDEKHPDYQNICKCLEEFSKINETNNIKINDHLKQRKILDLDKKFGTVDKPIVKEARQFIDEEPVNILADEMPRPVICFFFTDLILIVDESQSQVIKFIELDKSTLVKDLPNKKYFKGLFSVSGKESVTFLSDNLENKKKMVDFLKKTIEELKDNAANRNRAIIGSETFGEKMSLKKKTYTFNLTVVGSMKRGIQHFRPVTIYIVQIQFDSLSFRMYYRFSEMAKLNDLIASEFPQVKIETLPKKHWFRAQKTKIIESRKLLIENFLNSIFYREELNRNMRIFTALGLAEDKESVFSEEFIQRNTEKNKNVYEDLIEKEKFLGKSSIFSYIFKTPEYSCFSKGSFLFLSGFNGLEEARNIKIHLLNGETVTISANKYTKAVEACLDIAQKLNLKSHLDFKLFLSNDEDERMIENEEYLCQVLDYDPNKINEEMLKTLINQEKNKGSSNHFKDLFLSQINKFKKNWDDMCFCKYELVFKKYMFFPNDWEKRDLKKDPQRLNLVANQILFDSLHSKFKLSFEEYSLVAALRCYMEYGNLDPKIPTDPNFFDKARIFIPQLIIYHKTKNFWWERIVDYWRKFSTEIQDIHLSNLKYNDSKKNSIRRKMEDLKSIAEFSCFNFFKGIENFGERLFWVTSKKSPDLDNIKFENFLWMSVSIRGIVLLSPEEKKEIIRIELEKIMNICSYPNSFTFIFEEKEFSFYSSASEEICSLVRDYMNLRQSVKRKTSNK